MREYLDARDLPNPQPLVYTKRALAQGEFTELVVHVNNIDAKESVVRFARHAGFPVKKEEQREDEYYITIANNDSPEEEKELEFSKEEFRFQKENPLNQRGDSEVPREELPKIGVTFLFGVTGNTKDIKNTAAERCFFSLPSEDSRIGHLIFFGPALERLCSSEEWKIKTRELIEAGVIVGAEDRELEEIDKKLECGFPLKRLSLFSAADLAELLLSSHRVVEF
ncbi:MAG: sulfurtransferase TusA family protein [Spirochaetia bacterium]